MRTSTEHVLDAGARVLGRDRSAPLSAVAEAAGISRATLHRLYPTREALVEAIVERACGGAAEIFDDVGVDRGPVRETLVTLIHRLVPSAHLWAIALSEPVMDQVPRFAAESAALEQRLIALLRRGQEEGFLRRDQPAGWMAYFFGMSLGAVSQGVSSGVIAPRDAPALVASAVLDGIATR